MNLYRTLLILLAVSLSPIIGTAAANATNRDEEAHALIRELLSQERENMQVRCRLKMRGGGKPRSEALIRYTVVVGKDGWQGIYETAARTPAEQLVVIHREGLPNQYVYRTGSGVEENARPVVLSGSEASIPFAGSNFWLSDLGMEFLHWPEQRLVRDAKITMRKGRPCKVLESVSPNPEQGYARVVSWIDAEYGGLIYAETYNENGKRMKVFSIIKVSKVDGSYRPAILELRNDIDDSRTTLEFLFED